MSWPLKKSLKAIEPSMVGQLKPLEVLYEFEGPCIFTALTASQTMVLAYLSEDLEEESLLRFIVATTSKATIAELKRGVISVREALERGSLWLVDYDYQYNPQIAYAVSSDDLPEDALPDSETMLWRELEPALVVRLEGPEIEPGQVPAGALAQAAEISSRALKPVFEWAARSLRQDKSGRPPQWLQNLYALPTQRIAYGSLIVSFQAGKHEHNAQETIPTIEQGVPAPHEIVESAWAAIRDGLAWSVSEDDVPSDNEEKWLSILEAMRRLAPSSAGPVTSVKIAGNLVSANNTSFAFDRATAKRIRSALTELKKGHKVELRVFTGRIRDLDLDKLTMILRDVGGEENDVLFALDDDRLLDVAREAHYQELEVSVGAQSNDSKNWIARQIEFVATSEPNTA